MRKADNLPPYCAVVTKSGSLNFSVPCGPVQACYEAALPFFFTVNIDILHYKDQVVDGVQRNKCLRFVRMIPHTWYAVGTKCGKGFQCKMYFQQLCGRCGFRVGICTAATGSPPPPYLRHWPAKSATKTVALRAQHAGLTVDTLHMAKVLSATIDDRPRDDPRKAVSGPCAGGRC